ncbi:MAG: tRNA (guanosine(46)-N7)-methyltransferase TrmB [Bdellovibrio sp. CG12_big_fil_rev_8_21_14_0_65_39_13]|nr:MAG: tRNA (guanosine(46)-N7)-methyltransferase TrmB [Bdellovibrio sp. CG22_combo_CG10-13_8_21_14_all_39_27]PIQ59125.1 MAG: tRNA (guanosine(46)-N7)-methyltransferase TrmB [Bdellovibrio sp. CG12_big_fil_rev_8_21_14_0_65_39_13]PIR34389.1 MAG: tRNA (guanosine(46)-N7)-methyltransferase TrmB [Bdellovibrio sp. CG11_big_fil_rev_8_21_14_0_20_39_38]PJB52504.1 MAG: tRNA (guanosine(46)-N7)-methyltransferase TrmB [Bdellovibrio sp. CG_4_9_14_3_um_filter_39_7]
MNDNIFKQGFKYTHDNPYHEKLGEFSDFVFRDDEAETFKGKWNSEVFKRNGPLIVEIGSGYGEFMMEYCLKNPHVNFVGMDMRFKRTFYLAKKIADHPSKYFRYLRARGERIQFLFEENEVDELLYFFPDPWPKTRHWKKRLFQQPFMINARKVLKPGGKLLVKTDHDGYAEWMWEEIQKNDLFELKMKTGDLYQEYPDHFLASQQTKFEKIFIGQGTKIKAFELINRKEH